MYEESLGAGGDGKFTELYKYYTLNIEDIFKPENGAIRAFGVDSKPLVNSSDILDTLHGNLNVIVLIFLTTIGMVLKKDKTTIENGKDKHKKMRLDLYFGDDKKQTTKRMINLLHIGMKTQNSMVEAHKPGAWEDFVKINESFRVLLRNLMGKLTLKYESDDDEYESNDEYESDGKALKLKEYASVIIGLFKGNKASKYSQIYEYFEANIDLMFLGDNFGEGDLSGVLDALGSNINNITIIFLATIGMVFTKNKATIEDGRDRNKIKRMEKYISSSSAKKTPEIIYSIYEGISNMNNKLAEEFGKYNPNKSWTVLPSVVVLLKQLHGKVTVKYLIGDFEEKLFLHVEKLNDAQIVEDNCAEDAGDMFEYIDANIKSIANGSRVISVANRYSDKEIQNKIFKVLKSVETISEYFFKSIRGGLDDEADLRVFSEFMRLHKELIGSFPNSLRNTNKFQLFVEFAENFTKKFQT